MGPEIYELTQPPPGDEARRGTLAAEYVLALSVLRRGVRVSRRWRAAALLGWLVAVGLAAVLVAVW